MILLLCLKSKVMKTKDEIISSLKKALEELGITSSLRLPIIQTIEYLQEEPQVKESTKVQHVNETCKENGDSLTQKPVSKIIFDGNFNKSWYAHPELAFKAGMQEMREQMMKDAISAKVTEIYYPTDSCLEIEATLPEGRFKDGDKVLIIKVD